MCPTTLFLCHTGHFSWVWLGSFTCVIVLTAFLVEICVYVRTGINHCLCMSCNELSVVVVWPGPATSFCHKVLCFLPLLFVFSILVIVLTCYRAMQRVTVTKRLNCT